MAKRDSVERDSSGRLTAIGMAQVLAAGGSVVWQDVSITDPTQLPTQAAIDDYARRLAADGGGVRRIAQQWRA